MSNIYQFVGRKMFFDGYGENISQIRISTSTKREAIESMNKALLSYSYEKIRTVEQPPMDLSIVFDVIDSINSEEEQETFYSDCVHLMLNVYNNIENKNVLWSVVEEDISPQMVREGRYLEFFETSFETPGRESAEWLLNFLNQKYKCKTYTNIKNNK